MLDFGCSRCKLTMEALRIKQKSCVTMETVADFLYLGGSMYAHGGCDICVTF